MEVSLSFGNDTIAIQSARSGVAIYDRSHWGKILVGDRDRLRLSKSKNLAKVENRKIVLAQKFDDKLG